MTNARISYADMKRLADSLGSYHRNEWAFPGWCDAGVVAHLAHEVGHCFSVLDCLPYHGMEEAIHLTLIHKHPDRGVTNEALVLAAEAVATMRLGLPVPRAASETAGTYQDVPLAVLDAAYGSSAARALGDRVFWYLARHGGRGRWGCSFDHTWAI